MAIALFLLLASADLNPEEFKHWQVVNQIYTEYIYPHWETVIQNPDPKHPIQRVTTFTAKVGNDVVLLGFNYIHNGMIHYFILDLETNTYELSRRIRGEPA